MIELAIIIPAFKSKYLDKTLETFARQTNKNFNLYIGDDCSPEDLIQIISPYNSILNIHYTRFENNIGAEKLVNQWKRCVDLSKNEKWLWLFSDDDLVDSNCIELFYKVQSLYQDQFDVYRFNTTVIDNNGIKLYDTPLSPQFESSVEMAYNLLIGKRGNSICDHIFTRQVYNDSNGFVYTDFAQAADWATSILFSQNKGMCVIPGANFYWRYSGSNISSLAFKSRDKMFKGHIQFIEWIIQHFNYLKISEGNGISYPALLQACRSNLLIVIKYHYKGLNARGYVDLIKLSKGSLKLTYKEILEDICKLIKETGNFPKDWKGVLYLLKVQLKKIYKQRQR